MRLLITGATGFVGRHLVNHLNTEGGFELHGLTRRSSLTDPGINYHSFDWTKVDDLAALIRQIAPQRVVHLAGNADAGGSYADPKSAWSGNLTPTLVLYRAIFESGLKPRILHVSSGAVYGRALAADRPCDETCELLPVSPYASSKAAGEMAALQYLGHLPIIRVRPFNQIGPGQSNYYAIANFAEQIAQIESGLTKPVLEIGDLDVERDLTDVRDMVRAYRLLLESAEPGSVYNAGTGQPVKMRYCVEQLIGMAKLPIELSPRPERIRPIDIVKMRVCIRRLLEATSWRAAIPLQQSLADVLADWRRRVTN